MLVNAIFCLLIMPSGATVGSDTESAAVQVNVTSPTSTTEYKAYTTHSTTIPKTIICFFGTTHITTTSITPTSSTRTPPTTTKLVPAAGTPSANSTTFTTKTPTSTTVFKSTTLSTTTTIFTSTTPTTTTTTTTSLTRIPTSPTTNLTTTTPNTTTTRPTTRSPNTTNTSLTTTTPNTTTTRPTTRSPNTTNTSLTTTTPNTTITSFTTRTTTSPTTSLTTTTPDITSTSLTTTTPNTTTTSLTATTLKTTTTSFRTSTSITKSLTTTTPSTTLTMFSTDKPAATISSTTLLTSTSTTLIPPTTTFITTTTTGTTWNTGSAQCHNGGYFDGIQCVCPGDFYGTFCELIPNRITVGTVEAQVNVEVIFTNMEFTENLTDATSEEFKHFEAAFKSEMISVYYDVPGYKDVVILEIRRGSVVVSHKVVVEMIYKLDLNITRQYERTFQMVKSQLEALKSYNCTSSANPLCVDGNTIIVTPVPPPSEEELCRDLVPEGNEKFYSPVLFSNGLACVSHCDPHSPKYHGCNDGTCQIKSGSGPQCLCARADLYIYASSQCTGQISKLGLFIGCGVTIGILFILTVILGIYIYVVKRSIPKPFLTEDLYITTVI